jgi:hypothetical protein
MVGKHDEDEEHPQTRGGDREEIEGDQIPGVVGEERPPGLGRRGLPLREEPGDGAFRHVDAQLLQFAMDSGRSPQGIRRRHPGDQGFDLGVDGRVTLRRPAGELGPVLTRRRLLARAGGAIRPGRQSA